MGESILGFFLMALFSPYGSEDITQLLRQAIESDKCDPKIIKQLADNLGQDSDMVKKAVDNVRESYKELNIERDNTNIM